MDYNIDNCIQSADFSSVYPPTNYMDPIYQLIVDKNRKTFVIDRKAVFTFPRYCGRCVCICIHIGLLEGALSQELRG